MLEIHSCNNYATKYRNMLLKINHMRYHASFVVESYLNTLYVIHPGLVLVGGWLLI